MNKEQIRKIMEKDFREIDYDEWKNMDSIGESGFCVKNEDGETQILHFKPKEQ